MKNSVSESIARILAAVAFGATVAMAGGCVMDASPEPTPSTGSTTSEVDRTVHAPSGLSAGAQAPVANDQIAPKINGALGPSENSTVTIPGAPVLPLVSAPPNGVGGIDDPGGTVEDGPRPHPWEPAPDDPNGGEKPKIGGSEQSSSSTPTTGK